jgi:hypothetical protein
MQKSTSAIYFAFTRIVHPSKSAAIYRYFSVTTIYSPLFLSRILDSWLAAMIEKFDRTCLRQSLANSVKQLFAWQGHNC